MKIQTRDNNGLTLMELLTVIAIIIIIASILLPAFFRARRNAQRVYCMNNLKQIGMSLRMYKDDFGRYPQDQPDDFRAVAYYFGKYKVFSCPNDDRKKIESTGDLDGKTSYKYSAGDTAGLQTGDDGDGDHGHGNSNNNYDPDNPGNKKQKDETDVVYDRIEENHFGKFNVVFLHDLHYEFRSPPFDLINNENNNE